VSGLDCTLGNIVWDKEKVKLSINDFGLLNEALVHIGTLRWIQDCMTSLLKESLTDSLVDDDKSDLRERLLALCKAILICDDLLKLLKLIVDDLLSH
jgi:hypothetical protein